MDKEDQWSRPSHASPQDAISSIYWPHKPLSKLKGAKTGPRKNSPRGSQKRRGH